MSPVSHLYVHVPFCHHICPYCAFYKHTPGSLAGGRFVASLLEQLDRELESATPPHGGFETIYLGGGTPSILAPSHLETLCLALADRFDADGEWCLEANPATFDLRKARLMRDLGINRISLGIQSFQPGILRTLGRDHSGNEAKEAFALLREAGFENISVDLMFSIPGQDESLWADDLAIVTEQLRPDHVSCYNLTYEEDTEFLARHRSGELDASEDRDADLFHRAAEHLEAAGFRHYEISNYARPGHESRHNRAYWFGADYLGIGPSAVSTVGGRRWKTLPDTAAWIENPAARVEEEPLTEHDLRLEAIAMQLRTAEGVALDRVMAGSAGEDATRDQLRSLEESGLIETAGPRILLTRTGQALADPIASALF